MAPCAIGYTGVIFDISDFNETATRCASQMDGLRFLFT
jgi:hypothetical protein